MTVSEIKRLVSDGAAGQAMTASGALTASGAPAANGAPAASQALTASRRPTASGAPAASQALTASGAPAASQALTAVWECPNCGVQWERNEAQDWDGISNGCQVDGVAWYDTPYTGNRKLCHNCIANRYDSDEYRLAYWNSLRRGKRVGDMFEYLVEMRNVFGVGCAALYPTEEAARMVELVRVRDPDWFAERLRDYVSDNMNDYTEWLMSREGLA